jgi:hypothetical protein
MSDLSNRARLLATKEGLIAGGTNSKSHITFDLINALSELPSAPKPTVTLNRALFDMAALCSLYGIDIVDGVQMAIEQREITGKRLVPGTLAPVPNAKTNDGTLRDPAGERQDWE